tara:strand:+ start:3940 stop:4167 length:228 start_codon:yes stop_codon:yes gene_type:complete
MQLHDEYQIVINEYVLKEALDVINNKFSMDKELLNTLFSLLTIAHIEILKDQKNQHTYLQKTLSIKKTRQFYYPR